MASAQLPSNNKNGVQRNMELSCPNSFRIVKQLVLPNAVAFFPQAFREFDLEAN